MSRDASVTPPPVLYSLAAAGQALAISEESVRREVRAGHLRAVLLLGRLKVHRDDLEAYAQRLREEQNDFTQYAAYAPYQHQNGSVARVGKRSR